MKFKSKRGRQSRQQSQRRLKRDLAPFKQRDGQRPAHKGHRLTSTADAASLITLAPPRQGLRLPLHWQFWGILTTGLALGVGTIAAVALIRTPTQPRCDRVFWPLASASLRLHCAQVQANQQTLESLLEAIHLVNQLPQDHPLRSEINRLVEQWSKDIFDLAEAAYQDGNLERAIRFARQIPKETKVWLQVPPQIERWQETWKKAIAIDRQVESLLKALNWRQAFWEAVRLTWLGNRYWKEVRFEALSQKIMQAQEDETNLEKAQQLARQGDLDSLLQAMKLARGIGPESYFQQVAQGKIQDFSPQLYDLATSFLANQDLQGALAAAQAIPQSVKLWDQAQDFITLAYAQSWTWSDTVLGLEEAIEKAETLSKDRPLYNRAQDLIGRWQQEQQALIVLSEAQDLAIDGDIGSLNTAIAKAREVASSNPRWPQVRRQIGQWQRQIEIAQDQPILSRAEDLAWSGSVGDLQAAIQVASQIGGGRALSGEAQSRIQDWRRQIELAQDRQRQQQQLTETGSQSQELIQEARQLAEEGSSQSLISAIEIINQVSDISRSRTEADLAIDRWSQEILAIARRRAASDPQGAIAIAEQIPSFTGAYAEAQYLIRQWQRNRRSSSP